MASHERKSAQQRKHDTKDEQPQEQPRDQRDEKLDEDVACCLAEIDRILEEDAKSAQAKALEEFAAIKGRLRDITGDAVRDQAAWNEASRDLRIWQATYAHLGLHVGWCCGEPFAHDGVEVLA